MNMPAYATDLQTIREAYVRIQNVGIERPCKHAVN